MICIIVAHPDDESLWFGGTLLRFREWGIQAVVVCLTNANNPVRAGEFNLACQKLGSAGLMLDYPNGGHSELPDFGIGIERLLRSNSITVEDVACVITHPPTGNERSHPQHVQCFRHAQRWCREGGIPLGFFSDTVLPEFKEQRAGRTLNNGISLHRVAVNKRPFVDEWANLFQRTPMNVRGYVRVGKNWFRQWREFRPITHMLAISIDKDKKQALLETYSSQVQGLKEYQAYYNSLEYLYLPGNHTDNPILSSLSCA